jgi:hypothetical protein
LQTGSRSRRKIASLSARLVDPNPRRKGHEEDEDDDEALFAELEAEIENESNASMRERGLVELREEYGYFLMVRWTFD